MQERGAMAATLEREVVRAHRLAANQPRTIGKLGKSSWEDAFAQVCYMA